MKSEKKGATKGATFHTEAGIIPEASGSGMEEKAIFVFRQYKENWSFVKQSFINIGALG